MQISKVIVLTGLVAAAVAPAHSAESWQDVLSYSYFKPKEVNLESFVSGEVAGTRVPAQTSKYGMCVETMYLVPGAPDSTIAKMREDTGTSGEGSETLGREGRYYFSVPPTPADFAKLTLDPKKGPDKSLIKKCMGLPGKNDVNLSLAEASKLGELCKSLAAAGKDPLKTGAPDLAEGWKSLMVEEAAAFQNGGLAGVKGYENQKPPIRVDVGLKEILGDRAAVAQRFGKLMDLCYQSNSGAQQAALGMHFWERQRIQGDTTFNLGSFFQEKTADGYRAAELQYFVTSKYYTSLILYELWPVRFMDKDYTLVWRGDYVLTPYIPFVKGIERLAAENIMLIEIKKSVKTSLLQEGK